MDVQYLRKTTRLIGDIERCLEAIRNVQYASFGLTKYQRAYLKRISDNPGINQEQLSFVLKVDRSATAKAVKKLQDKGLIRKERMENNQKNWILFITEAGQEIIDKTDIMVKQTAIMQYMGVSDKEVEQLNKILTKIDNNLVTMYLGRYDAMKEAGLQAIPDCTQQNKED